MERSTDPSSVVGRTILVTGGAGFIGSHLVKALAADNDVYVVDNLEQGDRDRIHEDASFIEADVRDVEEYEEILQETDIVYHQAAVVSVPESVDRPLHSHDVNLNATLALLDRCREHDIRFVFPSSCAIYVDLEEGPVSENSEIDPSTPYGVQKMAGDHYCRLYSDLYDVETVVLRYFNVYGEGQSAGGYSGVVDIFVRQALSGDALTIEGDGSQTRDFIHVSDIVEANLLAATTEKTGEAYNVGTGESTTVEHLARTVIDIVDADSDVVYTDARAGDVEHSQADTKKASQELGFSSSVSLRQGLRSLADWYSHSGTV